MRKTFYFFALTLLLGLCAFSSSAAVGTPLTPLTKQAIAAMTPEQKQARLAEIKERIAEIKSINRSQLTREERKELRTELRGLRQESGDMVGVIYIGAGLLVFIGLLLLIFLR